jgi:hypothetical protein
VSTPSALTTAVPEWIEVHRGRAPLLLFAPHGGRRTLARVPGRDKVNDLHTAELTRELGRACDASWIVNATCDRNELDLNRTPQIRARAPWLLALLATTLEEMVAAYGRAVLLAVHGWNVVQAVCDVGVGLVEEHGTCRPAARGEATASPAFLDGRVRPLQQRALACDVRVTIGARYPAAHPSNLMQLFTQGRAADLDPALRRLGALAAVVDAAQLELGIPLRWPGPRRAAFVRTLTEVFATASQGVAAGARGADASRPTTAPSTAEETRGPTSTLACGGRPMSRVGLQLASGPLTLLASVDVAPSGAVAGRLLVSDAADRLALFTGELAERGTRALCVPALRIEVRAHHAFDVRFTGPLLAFPMLTPFADLEHGLAAGELREARIELRFTPANPVAEVPEGGARFGVVTGVVRIGRARHRIRAPAHASEGLGSPQRHPSARLVLPGTALGDLDLRSTHVRVVASDGPAPHTRAEAFHIESTGLAWRDGGTAPVSAVAELRLGARAAAHIRVESGGGHIHVLEGTLERLIPVRRPGAPGTVVETLFALYRTSAAAAGWLELTVEHAAAHDTD